MNNLSAWDYFAIAAGGFLIYHGLKNGSGWLKWAQVGGGAVLLYGVYEDYSGAA